MLQLLVRSQGPQSYPRVLTQDSRRRWGRCWETSEEGPWGSIPGEGWVTPFCPQGSILPLQPPQQAYLTQHR